MKTIYFPATTVVLLAVLFFSGCSKQPEQTVAPLSREPLEQNENMSLEQTTPEKNSTTEPYLGQTASDHEKNDQSKLCDWVDKSDIIIKLNFAEGVEKDISYEAGFFFGPTFSNRRLARSGCDYRTGFSFEEMKGKGAAEVGAIGYSDNRRRQIKGAPISIIFDETGKPNLSSPIEIMILD